MGHPFAAVIALGAVTLALAPLSVAPSLTAASERPAAQAAPTAAYQSPGPAVSLPSAPVVGTTEVLFPSTATAPGGEVPFALVDAYQRAVLASPTQCHLTVSLLSAIGQVESGNLAGETLDAQNRPTPPVLGPLPDKAGPGALPDTDGGLWDESSTWDRGVGPMQLIPSAWRTVAVDLDGDGLRDPQDVYDAAGAAMVHLCQGGRDLATPAGLRAAVLDYHGTNDFLRLVLSWKRHFDAHPLVETASGLDFLSLASAVAVPPYTSQDVVQTAGLTAPPAAPTTELARPESTATASPVTTRPGQPTASPTVDPTVDPTAPAQATPTGAPPTVDPGTPAVAPPTAPASTTAPAAPTPPKSSQPADPSPPPVCPTLAPEATATPGATATPLPASEAPAPADPTTPGAPEVTVPPGCPPLPTITPTAPASPSAP